MRLSESSWNKRSGLFSYKTDDDEDVEAERFDCLGFFSLLARMFRHDRGFTKSFNL